MMNAYTIILCTHEEGAKNSTLGRDINLLLAFIYLCL